VDIKPKTRRLPAVNPWVWRVAAMFVMAVGLSWAALVALNTGETIAGWPVAKIESWETQVKTANANLSFIGEPVTGSKVAFVFVGDDSNTPDLRTTARLANSLCQSQQLADVQFGFIQTSDEAGPSGQLASLLHEVEPIPVVTAGLQLRDEVTKVSASHAFAAVRAWQPDQIMVVLAHPIEDSHFSQACAEIASWNVPASFFATSRMLDVDLTAYGEQLGKSIMPVRPALLTDLRVRSGLVQ